MRAFVAVIPPAATLTELDAAVAPVRSAYPELRWTPAARSHVTLAFLGEVDEGVLSDLGERLSRVARRHPPRALAFTGGGQFGDRVLWTGVRGCAAPRGRVSHPDGARDTDDLRRLAASVTAAARQCGIAVDDRHYRSHLTLARARDRVDLRSAMAALSGFVGSSWTADALHLVRSRLGAGPDGTSRHEVVATWPLSG